MGGRKGRVHQPPYSNMASFLKKAHDEWQAGNCKIIFMLLPNRMHQVVWRETVTGKAACFILTGRVRYIVGPDKDRTAAPFGNVIAIFGATEAIVDKMLRHFDCVYVPVNSRVGVDRSRFAKA